MIGGSDHSRHATTASTAAASRIRWLQGGGGDVHGWQFDEENEGLGLYSVAMIPKDATASALQLARRVLECRCNAVRALITRLDERFLAAVSLILACTGRVIVGAASANRATSHARSRPRCPAPARLRYFVHPAEASHGDLGMVQRRRRVPRAFLSGESEELCDNRAAQVKRQGAKLIAIAGRRRLVARTTGRRAPRRRRVAGSLPAESRSHRQHDRCAGAGRCARGRAARRRGFGGDDFARSHPGGALGGGCSPMCAT